MNKKVAPSSTLASTHAPAVAMHQALHRGQDDAVALELLGRVQALEQAEGVLGAAHVEAGTAVHEEGALAVRVQRSYLDEGSLRAGARLRSRAAVVGCRAIRRPAS